MALPKILKKKSTYIVLAIILVIGVWYMYSRSQSGKIVYETAPVEKRSLQQTVEVTGEIKPAARIDLAFKNSGTIQAVNVKVGDVVKTGDVLAELEGQDPHFAVQSAKAALSVAQANLNSRLAGETKQSVHVAETQVDQAQAAYDKAVSDLDSVKKTTADSIRTAEIALSTAKSNLDNQGAIVTQNIQNAYDSAKTTLLTALGPLQTGLTDGDDVTGVDDTATNQNYASLLGYLDFGSMERAKSSYRVAKQSKSTAETAVKALNSASTKEQISAAADLVSVAINDVQTYLTDVQKVLSASLTSSYFTSTDLSSKKTAIDADRTSVSAQDSTVLAAKQAILNTELTKTQTIDQLQNAYSSAQLAYDTAKTNAEVQLKSGEVNVQIQAAAVEAAKATLDLKRSGPREVDVAPLRAAVEQANVAYQKALQDLTNVQIVSPVNGTISEVVPDVGEQITMNVAAIKMIGTESYDIEAKVPETDIPKIEVGQSATITLDAFGDEVKFKGTVTAKDPAETKVQDAVYYKIRVQIEPNGHEVKPSMTANVTILTGEVKDALVIPLRAIRTINGSGQRTVRVLKAGDVPEDRNVTIGLKGDEGRVEVLSGLEEKEAVILSEKK
ncbi:MAG: HlyD family efflux transporter periplasmic adaptor subunit [Patescibacteria group bacterium]|nr:HlyD family efflux transporter periplasmic adaptor subunit [Patescibacteria group bacterium]